MTEDELAKQRRIVRFLTWLMVPFFLGYCVAAVAMDSRIFLDLALLPLTAIALGTVLLLEMK